MNGRTYLRLLIVLSGLSLLTVALWSPSRSTAQAPLPYTQYIPYLRGWGDGVPSRTATPSPSPVATSTPTPTSTATPTPTEPATVTASPTVTATSIADPLPSASATPTLGAPSATATLVPIATLIELPTATTTPTATATPTPTPTFEPPIGQEFVLRAVADTFVTQGVDHQANSNWGRYGGMFIGFDYQEWLRQRILIRFDLSSLPPDTMILSATLKVRVKNCFRSSLGKCEHPMLVTVYNMAVPWGEYDATWNSVGGLYDREITTGWLVDGHSWSEFDVTTAAQMWQSGGPNYGVMLVGREIPPDDWWSIEAKEGGQAYAPQLVVRVLPMLR